MHIFSKRINSLANLLRFRFIIFYLLLIIEENYIALWISYDTKWLPKVKKYRQRY